MITNTFIVWNLTVERIFKQPTENTTLYIFTTVVGIINRLVSATLRLYLETVSREDNLSLKVMVKILLKDVFSMMYFLMGLLTTLYYSQFMFIL